MEKALLFINPHKERAIALLMDIEAELHRRGIESSFFSFEDKSGFDENEAYCLAFALGGDGTVLYAARTVSRLGVPIFPVNLGAVGFLAGISPDDWKPAFERCLSGGLAYSKRLMLEVEVERQGAIVAQGCCLNDAVVSASGIAKVIQFTVKAGGVGGAAVFLGLYRADGLIAATPTGSTAYSVAAGGPILDPEMEAIIINPICPFTLSNRPLVLPAADTVIIEVDSEQRSGVLLTLDGQVTEPLEGGDRILIRRAPYTALLAEADRRGFYRALRTKLS